MNEKEFQVKLQRIAKEVDKATKKDIPRVAGVTAREFFKESFHNEGFTDNSLEKWQEVKRRQDSRVRGARASRRILTGDTGDLGESIQYKVRTNEAEIYSDLSYAKAHNEGTTNAGRGNKTTIPKRQFIGESKQLNKLIVKEIERKLNVIFR